MLKRGAIQISRLHVSRWLGPGPSSSKGEIHYESVKVPKTRLIRLSQEFRHLPLTCPGCGAFSHDQNPADAGFYTLTRKPVETFLGLRVDRSKLVGPHEADICRQALAEADQALLDRFNFQDNIGKQRFCFENKMLMLN